MKIINNFLCLAMIVFIASCGSGSSSENKLESKGYFGKLVSIKQAYHDEDSAFSAKIKTEAKSVDDLVAAQSKLTKMEEDAKAEFKAEAAKIGLPITIPFIDSTGNTSYVVKDVKITAIEWDRATLEATIELKVDSEKTMGGQNMQFSVPALMLNENNQVIKDHAYDNWFIMAVSKEMKAGEIQKVTGSILIKNANAAMAKILFKSYDEYKKAKGWN
jgi:hypothetical protein